MADMFESVPKGSLWELHQYRIRGFRHVYYCYLCARSFDSKEQVTNCRTCGSVLRDITGNKFESPIAHKYRYYCPKCERNFESFSLFENCTVCSTKVVHIYKWEELGTSEKFWVQIKKRQKPPRHWTVVGDLFES